MKKIFVFLAIFVGALSLAAIPMETFAIDESAAEQKCEKFKGDFKPKKKACENMKGKVGGKSAERWCGDTEHHTWDASTNTCSWSKWTKPAESNATTGGGGSNDSNDSNSDGGTVPQDVGGTAGSSSATECGKGFLGFSPWYKGVTTMVNGRCEVATPSSVDGGLTKFVITIVLNILVDLSLAVGYLALGFIIYGGFLYVMAGGDPGKVAKGKKTLIAAIIGTAIAMLSTVIMNLIVSVLTGGN